MDLAKVVSTRSVYAWNDGSLWHDETTPRVPHPSRRLAERLHVVAYDFGIKRNILRYLADLGIRITVVPAQTPAAEVLVLQPDGIFLSNGPGGCLLFSWSALNWCEAAIKSPLQL